MYGIENRRAARGRSIDVLRARRRLRPTCEPLEARALLAQTNVPAWTGEWTMNGGASQPGGVTVDINFNDFYPHFLELVTISFNASYTGKLGLQGGATGSPAYSAFLSPPLFPKTSNATFGFDGELVGSVSAVPVAGTTLSPVVGSFDFTLTNPGSSTEVPDEFTGSVTFTGADGSANTSVPLDMTFQDFGGTQSMTNPDQYAGFDNPWDLPPIAPYTYDIAPKVQNQTITATAGQPVTFNVLDGATDPQGTTLSVQSISSSAGGAPNLSQQGGVVTASSVSPGIVTYNPPSNSNVNTDSFVYTAVNELGKTAVGTVTITINSANNGGPGGDGLTAPTVTVVSPDAGNQSGGTAVTIIGSGFTNASAVSFGGVAATDVTVNSSGTQITAAAPAGTGTVDVTVTTPTGTSATSGADQFTYVTGNTLTSIEGDVSVRTGDGEWRDATIGEKLKAGDEIHTGPESSAVVTFSDGSVLLVRQLTETAIGTLDGPVDQPKIRVLLKMGEIAVKVNHEVNQEADCAVRTPNLTASVRGCEFEVSYAEKVSDVLVFEGEVEDTPTKKSLKPVELEAGQQVQVGPKKEGPIGPTTGGMPIA